MIISETEINNLFLCENKQNCKRPSGAKQNTTEGPLASRTPQLTSLTIYLESFDGRIEGLLRLEVI
jgi:hypothetical protein